jgi:superfamily II DNA or RNA helicase
VKAGAWDGKIKLLNRRDKTIYKGLEEQLKVYCEANDVDFVSNLNTDGYPIARDELNRFLGEVSSDKFDRREYQLDAIEFGIRNKRATFLAATSAGKSFIIYSLIRFWDKPTLLIVPRVGLVTQMKNDFIDYAKDWDVEENVSMISAGADKKNLKRVVVSTWHSIIPLIEEDPEWFEQFDVVIGDECHEAKAKSLKTILEHMKNCSVRFGFTGTLDGVEVNELVVEGLFGPIKKVIKAHELIKQGYGAEVNIKCITFNYSKENKKPNRTYPEEISFINQHQKRLKFVVKLAQSLKGNTLILFRKIDEHGEILKKMADEMNDGSYDIHFVSGRVKAAEREIIRKKMNEREKYQNMYASEGTTSVGTNIKNIDYIIFASPSKSKVRVLQSIGRGLRKSDTKLKMTLFDLSDDLSKGKKKNYTYNHFLERLKMYVAEQFPYELHSVTLET